MDIEIDGAQGEGGGQILRSSLTMAALTGQSVTISNIRAGRAKPGLMRQHLTSVRAAAEVCGAQVDGDELRSTFVRFVPGSVRSGAFRFSIGTAGSTTLVCQTILPLLLAAKSPTNVELEGGTHNGMSPSFDFLQESFFGVLMRMGANVTGTLHHHGFYPAGGGSWSLNVTPGALGSVELTTPPIDHGTLRGLVSRLPQKILHREHRVFANKVGLRDLKWEPAEVTSHGPGNYLAYRVDHGTHCSVLEAVGEKNLRAEAVGKKLAERVRDFRGSNAGVEEHLADQLLIPMWMAGGGCFTTSHPSSHLTTNIEVMRKFVGDVVSLRESANTWEVTVTR